MPGLNKEQNELMMATYRGDLEAVKALVQAGVELDFATDGGVAPIHRAALGGHLEIVRWMAAHGADPTRRVDPEDINENILQYVVSESSPGMVDLLLQLGCDPLERGWMGYSALDVAKMRTDADRDAVVAAIIQRIGDQE